MNIRLIGVAVAVLAFAGAALAVTDPDAQSKLDTIRKGKNNSDQIQDLRVKDSAVIGGAVTLNGSLTVTGAVALADGSVAAADIAAGVMANKMTISNSLNMVVVSNFVLRTGGTGIDIRTGTCTNGQTISFSPAVNSIPYVGGTYKGVLTATETNEYGSLGGKLVGQTMGTSSFVLVPEGGALTYHTNQIIFFAIVNP